MPAGKKDSRFAETVFFCAERIFFMDKRTVKMIFFVILAVEWIFCYIWLIKPVGPVFLALLRGTFEVGMIGDLESLFLYVLKVAFQILGFSLLIVGTNKLYKYIYTSVPDETRNRADKDPDDFSLR